LRDYRHAAPCAQAGRKVPLAPYDYLPGSCKNAVGGDRGTFGLRATGGEMDEGLGVLIAIVSSCLGGTA
jgi:hypothetical protein